MAATVPIGEAAARKVADRLAEHALPPDEYARFASARTAPREAGVPMIDEIRVTGAPRVNRDVVIASMETKAGERLDRDKIDYDLRRIYGRGDFERVGYRLIEEPGRNVLEIESVQKSWGPDYLRFGVGLSYDFKGDAFFNLLGSYRRTWLNRLGAAWRTDLQVGRNSYATTELYQPLDARQYLFVALRLFVRYGLLNFHSATNKIGTYDRLYYGGALDFNTQLTRYGELRLGIERGWLDFSLNTGPSAFAPSEDAFRMAGLNFRVYLDQIDNWRIPKQGWTTTLNAYRSESALGASDSYTRFDASGIAAATWGRHTLQSGARYSGPLGAARSRAMRSRSSAASSSSPAMRLGSFSPRRPCSAGSSTCTGLVRSRSSRARTSAVRSRWVAPRASSRSRPSRRGSSARRTPPAGSAPGRCSSRSIRPSGPCTSPIASRSTATARPISSLDAHREPWAET